MLQNKISKQEAKLLKFSTKKVKDLIQLSGRPSTNFKNFVGRFFSKKITLFALFIFICLIVAAIVIQYTSQFSATESVVNKRSDIIANTLPTQWNGGWQEILIKNDFDEAKFKIILGDNFRTLPSVNGVKFAEINVGNYINKGTLLLGTNGLGQDNWTRVWVALLESIKLALFVATIEFFIGFVIGAFIGFHAGSKFDIYIMRIIDTISGVPSLIWFILFAFIVGTSFWWLSLALISVGWMVPVYLTRMYIIKVKNLDYIDAAKTIGVSKIKIIFKHAVPNVLGRMLSSFVRRIPLIIFTQASLAFLGLVDVSNVNLGSIINDAKSNLDNWAYLLTPTIILFSVTLSAQFIANGINDALEVKGVK